MPTTATPADEWLRLLQERVTQEFAVVLFAMGINTKDKFTAKRGMNN